MLGRGWVWTILSHSHGTGHWMMNQYFQYLQQSSIRRLCKLWMLQSLVCQTPAGNSDSFWGCWVEPNRHGGPYARNVTPIFNTNTAARGVRAVMKSSNRMLYCFICCGQQTDGTSGAQMPMGGACSYIPLDDILPPSAGDTINNFREELDDDAEMLHPNQRGFPATKTGFQEFKRKFQRRIIMQQRYLAVIRNHARSLFPN